MNIEEGNQISLGRVAILGQECRLREAARRIVRRLGYDPVVLSSSAATAVEPVSAESFKLLLVTGEGDSASSLALIREARTLADAGVPMLSLLPRNQFQEVSASREGARDEFIAKPASFTELFSILRLFLGNLPGELLPLEREWGGYRFLMNSNTVEFNGKRVQLRPDEFDLAVELFSNEGCTLGRDLLWAAVWARPWDGKSRMLDTCISVLRRTLKLPANGWELRAVWGSGYRLDGSGSPMHTPLPYWTPPATAL